MPESCPSLGWRLARVEEAEEPEVLDLYSEAPGMLQQELPQDPGTREL